MKGIINYYKSGFHSVDKYITSKTIIGLNVLYMAQSKKYINTIKIL
jgi:hypothetical protein